MKYIIMKNKPLTELEGRSLLPLYELEYDAEPGPNQSFWNLLDDIRKLASVELEYVIRGEKSIDEALISLQKNGQLLLDELLLEQTSLESDPG